MVSIMPGMENFAPERTLTSSGLSAPPSFWPCSFSSWSRASSIWRFDFLGDAAVAHVLAAGFGLDGEAGRHGQSGVGHLGEAGAFAAQHVFHLAVAVGVAVAEEVNVLNRFCARLLSSQLPWLVCSLLGPLLNVWRYEDLVSVTISLKSAMVENSSKSVCNSARRLARTCSSSTMTITLSKKRSTGWRRRLISVSAAA